MPWNIGKQKPISKNPRVGIEELILANSIQALLNLLEIRGVVSRAEVLNEIDRVKRGMDEKASEN